MTLTSVLCDFYAGFSSLVYPMAVVMVAAASATYAVASLLPPEARARAINWAQNLLIGAVMGLVFFHLGLWMIKQIVGVDVQTIC